MLALEIESCDEGRFRHGCVESGEFGHGRLGLFGTADPDVVWDSKAEKVVAGVH